MSFSTHPYRHLNLVDLDDNQVYYWRCDSCGADGKHAATPIPFDLNQVSGTTMLRLVLQYHQHISKSHCLSREDVQDWSL